MRVLVALSGGIDSSVAACLLQEKGYEVIGVHMSVWEDPLAPPLAQVLPKKCCTAQGRARIAKITKDRGIPLHNIDIAGEFKCNVVNPFIEDYKNGMTPNPCVICNRRMKHKKLMEISNELECDKIATGHYARIANMDGRCTLLEALDKTKDQSYYLYRLSREQLAKSMFPLGALHKNEVFEMAKKFDIPVPDHYQESQDLCFFPDDNPHDFLDRYIEAIPGNIVNTAGKKLGKHTGLHHYTEGQRRGLRIGGLRTPLYVIKKNVKQNLLIVGTKEEAGRRHLEAGNLNWISFSPEKNREHLFDVRIHALGKRCRATMEHDGVKMNLRFEEPQFGVSPGQSAVLYDADRVVGGGIIRL